MKDRDLESPYCVAKQKITFKGVESLLVRDLLVLISQANNNESAMALYNMFEKCDEDISNIKEIDTDKISLLSGIDNKGRIALSAAVELSRRILPLRQHNIEVITNNTDVITIFRPIIESLPYEELWALYLTGTNRVIDRYRLSYGGIDMAIADVRIVLKHAIDKLASTVILIHNHPSGNCEPSRYDKEFTAKINDGCKLLDITLLDHIIISSSSCFSFKDKGLL